MQSDCNSIVEAFLVHLMFFRFSGLKDSEEANVRICCILHKYAMSSMNVHNMTRKVSTEPCRALFYFPDLRWDLCMGSELECERIVCGMIFIDGHIVGGCLE